MAQNQEHWRAVDGFINYEVSDLARIRNAKTGRILRPALDHGGYSFVILSANKKTHCKKIHRLVADSFVENKNGYNVVDHIDNNITNNNPSNLRWCLMEQNNKNRKKTTKQSTSQYKGVFWNTTHKKWFARVNNNKKAYHVGSFDNEKEAAKAYNDKATQLFGEFANLNIIL